MYFDSHAHLEMAAFDADREAVFARAAAAGVTRFMVPAYNLEASVRAVALAEARDGVWASVGIHPHGAGRCTPEAVEALEALARHPRVVAIGETGLDFYRNRAPRQAQEAALRAQMALARRLGLPLIIHCRDAYPECLAILREEGAAEVGGVLHCFTADAATAAAACALNFFCSIAGPITYPDANGLRAAVRAIPADRLLLETDAPYLSPAPHRRSRNEPAHLPLTAAAVAAARGVPVEEIAAQTAANARRLFRLP